jgi:molybdate transport system substrate-binding protein
LRRGTLILAAVLGLVVPAQAAGPARLTVFAASSLTDVLPALDHSERYVFAGSDQLAFQIEQGAPADVFAAASTKQPRDLYHKDLLEKPVVFATNRLVLIVPVSNPAHIRSVNDLKRHGIRLVIGAKGVPIGDYTRKVLARLGLSKALENVVSEEPDVRGVLTKVALGDADAGFVYATDVRSVAGKVRTIRIPVRAQPTVLYEAGVVRGSKHRSSARAFLRLLLGPEGRRELRRFGFGLP